MDKTKVPATPDEGIRERFDECLRSFMDIEGYVGEIKMSDNLQNDLGLDSLQRVDLVIYVEHGFSVELSNAMGEFKTVQDVYDQLVTALQK